MAGLVALGTLVLGFAPAHARGLNLHGVLEITSRWSRFDQRVLGTALTPTVNTGLLQHYQLGSTGEIYHPNLGSYTASVSLTDDVGRLDGDESQDLAVKDFYFSMNFLPRITPVSFYAQRIIQDNDAVRPDQFGTVSTNSTYNLTWDIPMQRTLPRFRVNLWQTELDVDSTLTSSFQRTRSAALDADGRTGNTRYVARYQITQLAGLGQETNGYTITGSADTQFTPALSGAARANYSSSVSTLGVVTPGLGTLLQRSAGASVFYRPSLNTTASGTYDYYRDPFIRHLAVASATLRPLQELDVSGGYRLSRFDVPDALTTSHYAYASANYRPILGLSTNLTASVGYTDISGLSSVTSNYQNYGYGANYLKTLTLVVYRLGYQGGYGHNKLSTPTGSSTNLTNVFTAGLSNTQTRLVSVSGDYALSLVHSRTVGAEAADQTDHRFQVTASSNAPHSLFLPGDFLVLTGLTSYTLSQYRDFSNHVFVLSTTDTYETGRGIAATVGYTYEQQSQLAYDYKNTSFIQVRWLSYIVRNGALDLTAKQAWERYAGNQPDVTRSEGGALFTYYLGRISLSADYRILYETRPDDRQLSQSAFFKAARPF
ncbi:MAG: hypothetical protein AB1451_16490 [Nitrospirota bacterium]